MLFMVVGFFLFDKKWHMCVFHLIQGFVQSQNLVVRFR